MSIVSSPSISAFLEWGATAGYCHNVVWHILLYISWKSEVTSWASLAPCPLHPVIEEMHSQCMMMSLSDDKEQEQKEAENMGDNDGDYKHGGWCNIRNKMTQGGRKLHKIFVWAWLHSGFPSFEPYAVKKRSINKPKPWKSVTLLYTNWEGCPSKLAHLKGEQEQMLWLGR